MLRAHSSLTEDLHLDQAVLRNQKTLESVEEMSKSGGQAKTLAGLMGIILRAREKKQPPQEKLNEVKAVSPELDSSTTLKDDVTHNRSWVKRNSNTLRTVSSLHRVHNANPSLVDYTSTLSHTRNPT